MGTLNYLKLNKTGLQPVSRTPFGFPDSRKKSRQAQNDKNTFSAVFNFMTDVVAMSQKVWDKPSLAAGE